MDLPQRPKATEEVARVGSATSQTPKNFVYEPLNASMDSIRLLMLLPHRQIEEAQKDKKAGPGQTIADSSDSVCCELIPRTFASKPKYEALSYTWGDDGSTEFIKLNGRDFLVRKNLYNALRQLRSSTEKRAIWVDAICINQEDILERGAQVGIMAFIYSRAQRVLVWLSVPVEPIPASEVKERFMRSKVNNIAISKHSYWSRLWILQEVGLAHEVQFVYGPLVCTWEELDKCMYNHVNNTLRGELGIVMKQREKRHTQEHRLELLMENFQKARCSELRDKIFGFLGLAHDCQDDSLNVDYKISMYDLYVNAIGFHQSARPLDNGSDIHKIVDRHARLMKFGQLVQRSLEGSVNKEAKLRIASPNPRLFVARGFIAGKILYLGPTYSDVISSYKADKEWRRSIDTHYTEAWELDWLRKYDQSYSRIILDWEHDHLDKIRAINSGTSFGFRWNADETAKLARKKPAPEQSLGGEPRRFLATEILIGFVPPQAQVGDLIVQFWGCDIAVVVRQQGTNDYFRIVGRADVSIEKDRARDRKEAINLDLTRWPKYDEAAQRRDFHQMMNLRLDIDTLQKLTC